MVSSVQMRVPFLDHGAQIGEIKAECGRLAAPQRGVAHEEIGDAARPMADALGEIADLYVANTPSAFWQLLVEPTVSPLEWAAAVEATASILSPISMVPGSDAERTVAAALGEAQVGPERWHLGRSKRLYYRLKPLLPRKLGIALRQRYRSYQAAQFPLAWPLDDRYARFHYACVAHVLRQRGLASAPFVNFWPDGHQFALVLTHDVEHKQGHAFVQDLADLEERLGFRSVFNFVPVRYPIDHGLLSDLQQRGFEIGVHGLKHDGMLFSSKHVFDQRAAKINRYLHRWNAVGFRAPYMHRHPAWLQALQIEYDLSFFDTDPYEPMPGGTMSIWPFFLGHFVELPYTLAQDHTLMVILAERTPRLWLEKVNFIARWHGMALVNTHPDYLLERGCLAIYQAFLEAMKERANYWHALPREVARWWRQRAQVHVPGCRGQWDLSGLPGATLSQVGGTPVVEPLIPALPHETGPVEAQADDTTAHLAGNLATAQSDHAR